MEQKLRAHREEALKLLRENRAQAREAIDLLVRERLYTLTEMGQPEGSRPPSAEALERLYNEVLDLAYTVFALGYTIAKSPLPRGN